MSDYMVRATAANAMVRLFVCNSKELVEKARQIHQTTPVVTAALGRLMTAGSMMGTMLKGEKDLLTIQIKSSGPIGGLTVTADSRGMVKGYPDNAQVDLPLKENGKLDVGNAMGIGVLNVIKDMGLKEPYVGQTVLQTGEIGDDLTYYFATSEQIPSSVGLGVLIDRDYTVKQAGGFIVQLMPFATDEVISQLEENLSKCYAKTFHTNFLQQIKGHFMKPICIDVDRFFYSILTETPEEERAMEVIKCGLRRTEGLAWERF